MRILFSFVIIFLTINLLAQNSRILIEGEFEDWATVSALHSDNSGDDSFSNIDFTDLKVSHDDDFIYFQFSIGTELNLQDFNDITLYLDTDNNSGSGISFHGIGAELVFNFGERDGTLSFNNNNFNIEHDNIGLVTAPTVTSDIFELAISRDITVFGQNIFSASTMKIVLEDDVSNGDRLPNSAGGVSYNFDNQSVGDLPEFSFQNNVPESFRVMSYNVLTDNIFDSWRFSETNRIFDALQPQIIGFQEIYDNSASQTGNLVEDFLPSSGGENWYSAKVNPDIVCVSRYEIKESHIIEGSSGSQNNGAFLIQLPEPFDKELLFIVAHTPCCGNNLGRQEEVDAIMAFIRDSRMGETSLQLNNETPIIIVGDMNLVGDAKNFETLLTGDIEFENEFGEDFQPDWDDSPLEDAFPYVANTPFSYTWYNDGSSFFPGRIDVVLYSGSVLEKQNAFTLNSATLSANQLATNGLFADDCQEVSDHLPVITDFKLKDLTSVFDLERENSVLSVQNIQPNPANDFLSLQYFLKEKSNIQISILNNLGQPTPYSYNFKKGVGEHVFEIENLDLPKGVYYLKMEERNEKEVVRKVIIK